MNLCANQPSYTALSLGGPYGHISKNIVVEEDMKTELISSEEAVGSELKETLISPRNT